jgi:AraC family transcriptional regulator of adaptative response/methylated-DNA-[protein]-cysteine methyltransferase
MVQGHHLEVSSSTSTGDWRWAAVLQRDRQADGRFVYGVTSTGVFCRPSCPSRRPRPERVRYFDSTSAAEAAGFRACRRCRPTLPDRPVDAAVRRAAAFLAAHAQQPVSLATLARVAGVSPFHLQRQFKKALHLSPRQFQAACRADRFRQELRSGRDVAAAIYEAGYGSPSRVYEASPTGRGMAPSTYRRGGVGSEIGFVTVHCDLGTLLVAATAKGLCAVKLGDTAQALESDLRREFPHARISPNRLVPRQWVRAIVRRLRGGADEMDLPLDVRGTAFQWRVWRALQEIPAGETRPYAEVARTIGQPSAARAVARACATNPVCLVIPCHRVVAKAGGVGGYRWGVSRKARLLARERKRSKILAQ